MKKVLGFAVLLLFLPAVVSADGMVIPRPSARVEENGQRAVIWHDGVTETLILSTSFKGDAEDFAWIIPVPAKPEVDQAKDELFTALDDYTKRNYQDRYPNPVGLEMMDVGSNSYNGVTVVETKKVDIYDIAVLEATDGTALRRWLEENGYEYPVTREHLLQHYIAKNWYFVAAKVSGNAIGYAGAALRTGHATPLEIKFASKQIVYPLKISGPAAEFSTEKLIAAFGFEYTGGERWSWGSVTNDDTFQGKRVLSVENSLSPRYTTFTKVGGLRPGTKYVFSAYGKVESGAKARLKLGVSGNGVNVAQQVDVPKEGSWQRLAVNFVAGGTGEYKFELDATNLSVGESVLWDAVMIEAGEEPTEFVKEKLPGETDSSNANTSVPIVLYVFANNKKTVPGFETPYAGELPVNDIERLAYKDDVEPWIKPQKKMYLTKLTRSLTPAQMTDDLIIREAADNKPVGGVLVQSVGWRSVLVLGIPVVAELLFVVYYWYSKRKKES